ncbi:MAG TPA: hypothetical protein VL049_20685, partial [Candidatus Dormibacteraeota bacterium]|nr:hypothetical protein [Candidatus Dormibacteraeota bacterium]
TGTAVSTQTPTRTPAPTLTATPQIGAVAGLVVVDTAVGANGQDGITALPPESLPPLSKGFDRGLGAADWVADDGDVRGETDGDGRFVVTGLTPGRHALRFTKTVDGNLMEFVVPIIVGDDGAADVVAEVSWGLVRATSTYVQGGAQMRAVFAPTGTSLITRGNQVVELSDTWRTLVDTDGDGRFDPQDCGGQLYACDENSACNNADDICVCVPSCPDCEDCPRHACVPRNYFHTDTCGPDGLCKRLPYACGDDNACSVPGDQCQCIASCFACDNCEGSACVEPCQPGEPIDIVSVTAYGPSRLVVGQPGDARAAAVLSDGTSVDVTWLATWSSSAPAVATIDAWGRIDAIAAGDTSITAAIGAAPTQPLALTVVERPTLQKIIVENLSCQVYAYPVGAPGAGGDPRPLPPNDAYLPPPYCQQVVRIGGTVQFRALGQFDTGYYDDITDEVTWAVDPAAVGSVAQGLFTGAAAGVANLTATLGDVHSDAQQITVVDHASIVALTVYPGSYPYQYLDGGPVRPGADAPCYECGYFLTLLLGDQVQFFATAHYDTGEWEDVSTRVAWRSSDAAVMTIDAAGNGTAVGAGEVAIDATLDGVTSAPATLRVVDHATLQNLTIYMDGADRAIATDAQAVFHAVGFYDVGFDRSVSDQVTWHSSDEAVGGFDATGVFTGRSAGNVTVWAELDGVVSPSLPLEVYATSELAYCNADAINRAAWSDDFNRVTLESDCATYTPPAVVELRFTVTETQHPGGIFDPCLDLYAYQGDRLVRTIRQEGCGDPFLAPSAPGRDEAALRYQLKAFWDLKDSDGNTVTPGDYEIRGRFYLYYDPVVTLTITVE